MFRDSTFEAQSAKPAVGEIEMNLLTQSSLGPDAIAVADQQHSDHQFRINRGPPGVAVERRELATQPAQIEDGIDFSQ